MDKATRKENVILYESSGVSVCFSGLRDHDREFHFSDRVSGGDIVSKSVGDLGANISQEDHKRIRQLVDIARSCNSEFEASLALTGNVNVRIRRESKKVIRIVAE
jgi:hypothetical protein